MQHQPIHSVIDSMFLGFFKNNKALIQALRDKDLPIMDVSKEPKLCSIGMMNPPFNVQYIAAWAGEEGDVVVFLDSEFNKMFTYYDVE